MQHAFPFARRASVVDNMIRNSVNRSEASFRYLDTARVPDISPYLLLPLLERKESVSDLLDR